MLGIAIRKSYRPHKKLGKKSWERMIEEGEGGWEKGGEVEGQMVMREGDLVLMSGGRRGGFGGLSRIWGGGA